MHKLTGEAEDFTRELLSRLPHSLARRVAIAPSFTALWHVGNLLRHSPVALAAQNVHDEPQGAFTGEISAPMLTDVGCRYVIVGHSERRHHFGETDTWIGKKLRAVLIQQMNPILCLGEALEEREAGRTVTVVNTQLQRAVAGLSAEEMKQVIIAYEPVWAIGTGKTATPHQAEEVHRYLRTELASLFSDDVANAVSILYGGSVNAANISSLMAEADIDGVLVGGASLKVDDFLPIILYD